MFLCRRLRGFALPFAALAFGLVACQGQVIAPGGGDTTPAGDSVGGDPGDDPTAGDDPTPGDDVGDDVGGDLTPGDDVGGDPTPGDDVGGDPTPGDDVGGDPTPIYIDKIMDIPDYYQRSDEHGGFENDGRAYCGPVAVSNSLMWLDDNGYDAIVVDSGDPSLDQHDLIVELAVLMSTDQTTGTSANNILNGIHSILADREYDYVRLEYQGWRYHNAVYSTGVDTPEWHWLEQGVEGMGSVWLNFGWYEYEALSDTYTRLGGHWITLVGYGWDGSQPDPDYLVVHDPADGSTFTNRYIALEPLASGTLAGSYTGLPRSAVSYLVVVSGMSIGYDAGILDGAIVLEMN